MALWAPGTARVEGLDAQDARLVQSHQVAGQTRLAYRAGVTGTYYLELKLVRKNTQPVSYRLALTRG
jgi:hypothetical protein